MPIRELVKNMRKIVGLLVVLALIGVLIPSASASDDSMKVIVVVEDKTYVEGDTVNIEVHVFDKGEYVTADEVNVSVGYWPATYVTVTETSTGIYEGTYTVKSTDTYISISATAEKGTDTDSDSAYISIGEEKGLSVSIKLDDPSDYYAQPGDAVEMTITVREDDTNVNADTFDLTVNDEALTHTNPSTGVYKATYNIDPDLTEGKSFSIHAEAEKGDKSGSTSASFYVLFYYVWYHKISTTNTSASFEVCVSDPDGKAVSGANVNISYDDDGSSWTPDKTEQKTTDSAGKASFSISYTTSYLSIDGTASAAGKTQEFSGSLSISAAPDEPEPEGFDVLYTGESKMYSEGDTVTKEYTAYNDGAVWANKDIYYYITKGSYPASSIIKHGKVTTGSNGKFTITFTAPGESAYIYFETGTPKTTEYSYDKDDNLVYDTDSDYVFVTSGEWSFSDSSVSITVDKLKVGGKTKVTVKASNVPSDTTLMAFWAVGKIDTIWGLWGFVPDWQCWNGGGFGLNMVPLTKTDGEYVGYIVLPEFMPEDSDYTVFAGWGSGTEVHINHLSLKPGESATTEAEKGFFEQELAGIPLLYWLIIIVVIVVIIVIAVVALKRKKKAPVPPSPPQPGQPPMPPMPPQTPQPPQQPPASPPQPPQQPQAQPAPIPEPTAPPSSMIVSCYKCGQRMQVTSSVRPIEVTCPKCGAKGILK